MGGFQDNGYDYVDGDNLAIFVTTEKLGTVPEILAALSATDVCGNQILDSAVIGVDSGDGYTVIHPADHTGDFIVE